jgi:hypothetical protein
MYNTVSFIVSEMDTLQPLDHNGIERGLLKGLMSLKIKKRKGKGNAAPLPKCWATKV